MIELLIKEPVEVLYLKTPEEVLLPRNIRFPSEIMLFQAVRAMTDT